MRKLDILCSVTIVALCAALFAPGHGLAQDKKMYQWTDQDGVVHFSDTAPAGMDVPATDIPMDEAPAGVNPYEEAASGPSAAQQQREEIARQSEQNRAERANRDSRCAAWRAELERLEPNRRVFYTNDQGETERMDDVARTDRVAELKAQIAENCG
jgi:hypothetical protein